MDNISSFSVPDGDYAALTDKLLYVLENKSAFSSKECPEFIKNRFNVMDNYMEYIKLYREIYQKNNAKMKGED